ncbi:MAG TPA: xanthine dehydrogenase family protein subunit M [Candidatus Limnocylindria bacterium]|nr:xanthine dehydrogenase family protein subunit M [Candidatus Limnocylindria bacterium]
MRLPPFELSEPATIPEALDIVARHEGECRLIAGGTALVPMLRLGLARPERLVSLHRIPGLAEIRTDGNDLVIGAMATHAAIHRDPLVVEGWPLLAEAAGRVASPSIRASGTLGGNLCYAESASDVAPALLCLDAEIIATGPRGERRIALAEFFRGFYETALEPGEILTSVRVPGAPRAAKSAYVKFCPRSAEDRALIGVAVRLVVGNDGRRCADVRIALAAAAPTPIRAHQAEAELRGQSVTDAAIAAAAEAAATEGDPLSDLMGSADYRRQMIRVWVRRVVTSLRDGTPLPNA